MSAIAAEAPVAAMPTSSKRDVERNLLIFAFAIGVVAYLTVDLVVLGHLTSSLPVAVGVLGALLMVAHLGVRLLAPFADPFILPCVALLNIIGLVMIHRLDLADQVRAQNNGTALPRADAEAQFTWLVLSIASWTLRTV